MGIYLYGIKRASGRKMKSGEIVYKPNFICNVGSSGNRCRHVVQRAIRHEIEFDQPPLFVHEFKHCAEVYRKKTKFSLYYDCDDYARQVGYLIQDGARFQVAYLPEIDQIVRENSAFRNLHEMTEAAAHGYRPTIHMDCPARVVMAEKYDERQKSLGCNVRAFRAR